MKTYPLPENTYSCVIVRDSGALYVQSIDAYSYQRELFVTPTPDGYSVHVYQHPGRREIQQVSRKQGAAFIAAFLNTVEKYPASLFSAGEARNRGFVNLCEDLHRGEEASAKLV